MVDLGVALSIQCDPSPDKFLLLGGASRMLWSVSLDPLIVLCVRLRT